MRSPLFVRFQLDAGADVIVTRVETVQGIDWLGFCGIPSPIFAMISIGQQFAEKLHAYTLSCIERPNTRVKDLVDYGVPCKNEIYGFRGSERSSRLVFKVRQTYLLPQKIDTLPSKKSHWQSNNSCAQ